MRLSLTIILNTGPSYSISSSGILIMLPCLFHFPISLAAPYNTVVINNISGNDEMSAAAYELSINQWQITKQRNLRIPKGVHLLIFFYLIDLDKLQTSLGLNNFNSVPLNKLPVYWDTIFL